MAAPPHERVRKRLVWFSPYLFVIVLSSPVLQGISCSPATGDATLSALEVEVLGQNQISAFDSGQRIYNVWLPLSADTATVRAYSTDPGSTLSYALYEVNIPTGTLDTIEYGYFPVGGGEVTLTGLLPEGRSQLYITVRAPGGAKILYAAIIQVGCSDCDDDDGNECTINSCEPVVEQCVLTPVADDTACDFGGEIGTCVSGVCEMGFPCTEQGILDAIALGGGPHTFACNGPTTVTTQGEIFIYNDVILDGEGNLTIDGNDDHRVLSVEPGITAELVGMTITRGLAVVSDMGSGIYNRGTLALIDSTVSFNRDQIPEDAAPIHSEGTLVLINSRVSDNASSQSGSILCTGSTTLINSTVSENDGGDISGIEYYGDGFLHVINSTVIGSPRGDQGGAIGYGGYGGPIAVMEVRISNSILVSRNSEPTCVRSDDLWTSGGGNIEVPGDTCDFTDSTDLVNVTEAELNLGPLADNGGPTMTHALLPGSVAIDHVPVAMCVDADGQPLTTDQRGVARPQGGACDVGAFEWADCAGSACDDGNDCTADQCDPATYAWCAHTTLPDGTLCGVDGVCEAGACRARSWGTPVLIGTDDLGIELAQVAVDASGNAIALWNQYDGTWWNIWSNRYTPNGGWGTAGFVSIGSTQSDDMSVAVDVDGYATAVWPRKDGGNTPFNIWSNRYTPGAGWGTAEIIDSDDAFAASPQVAVDPDGNVTAVWQKNGNIWSNRYTPNAGWGTPELIGDDTGGGRQPQVAVDADGNATAVWSSALIGIWSNRYTPSGGWGAAVRIENDNGSSWYDPELAVDPDGNATAVWMQADAGGDNIWSNRYTPSGGWEVAVLIGNDTGGAEVPQVAVDPNGNVTAVWFSNDADTWDNIWSNRYTPSGGWGMPVLIESDTGGAKAPQVAVDLNGNATAVWQQNGNIWSNRYTPGGGWGTAVPIETNPGYNAEDVQVAVDAVGNATAVWSKLDGATPGIWSNRYE